MLPKRCAASLWFLCACSRPLGFFARLRGRIVLGVAAAELVGSRWPSSRMLFTYCSFLGFKVLRVQAATKIWRKVATYSTCSGHSPDDDANTRFMSISGSHHLVVIILVFVTAAEM